MASNEDSSNSVGAKAKPRGKPFQKGGDERQGPKFQKGVAANPNGARSKKTMQFSKGLRDMLVEEGLEVIGEGEDQMTKIRAVVKRLYFEAGQGEAWAVKEIFDRVWGKSQENVHVTTEVTAIPAELKKNLSVDELRQLEQLTRKLAENNGEVEGFDDGHGTGQLTNARPGVAGIGGVEATRLH